MKVSECRKTAGEYLRGRRGEAFVVTAMYLFAFLTFKTVAVVLAYLAGNMKYFSVIDAAVTVTGFLFMTPLLTGGFWWFFRTVCDEDNSSLLKLYSGLRLNSRAALVYALMWSKGFFSLLPSAVCFMSAYVLFYGNFGLESDMVLFLTFQLVMLGIVLILLYLNALASMVPAPFLFISHPDRNPFGVLRSSAKLMKGHKLRFMGLVFGYIPIMLPIVTIPFVMPRAVMAAAVFARDVIRTHEEEQHI